jgi:RNA 3'-phosphate cyclase
MIEIDGSFGESGGQILRTSSALSVITGKPIRIFNIRAKRRKPGLRPQHRMVLMILKKLSGAKVSGMEIDSGEITFEPGNLEGGEYRFDIGTAGSIPLVFEACILALSRTEKKVSLEITGGTDVKWSPSWDFFENVFVPLTRRIGLDVRAKLVIRGHHPEGGGRGKIEVFPSKEPLPLVLDGSNSPMEIEGNIYLSNLPDHIAKRMRKTAVNMFLKEGLTSSINIHRNEPISTGTGITLWSISVDKALGVQSMGERGVTSEKVAENAVRPFLDDIRSGATIDVHSLDQMIPFMVLSKGPSSCFVRSISGHSSTNMAVTERFLGKRFETEERGSLTVVRTRESLDYPL